MRDWSPRRTWKWAWWCAGGTRCTSRAVGGPSVASVSFARHQAGRHLHIVAERGGGGCRSRTSASAHAAWGERHSPGSGRSATSSARVGWSGWACASVDGWFMEHVAGAGAGETLRRVRRVEREMLSWLLVYYLFCIGGAAIGSPRHPLLT